MQNETQNQNIDTKEVKVEEAPVQTETPQDQNIGVNTDQYRGPDVEEPANIDPKVTMSSDDLVGSDPKVTMNPEDIFGPETAQEPGFAEGEPDFTSNGGDAGWDSDFFAWGDEPGSEGSIWDSLFPDVPEDTTPGGYDSSGIAGGLDQNGMPENTGINPHVQPGFPGNDPVGQHEGNVIPDEAGINPDTSDDGYTYDENAYEDAEDALEDLQDALQDGDEEDLAEALEELQDYLGGFGKGDEEEDQDGTKTQDNQLPSDSEDDSDGGGVGTIGDLDGDGIEDWEDDSDGDGVADWVDFDSDNDGIEDWKVLDSDGNGIEDGKEDSDGDGLYDWQDSDSNGDGIDDWSALLDLIEEDPGCFPEGEYTSGSEYDPGILW
jgi:hypothetical protein